MAMANMPIRAAGVTLVAAGACYLPPVFVTGWRGIADIGTANWWIVLSAAAAQHVFLLFGLIGLYAAAVRRPGWPGLAAFGIASTGNLLMTGVGAVQLTMLPALASRPEAAAALDCTPFYPAATRAAASFIERACAPWQFGPLEMWVSAAWMLLALGSLWLAAEIWRGGVIARPVAALLGLGWAAEFAGIGVTLPAAVARVAWLAIAAALIWSGAILLRNSGRRAIPAER